MPSQQEIDAGFRAYVQMWGEAVGEKYRRADRKSSVTLQDLIRAVLEAAERVRASPEALPSEPASKQQSHPQV